MSLIPDDVAALYEVHEWHHASAVLSAAHPDEWNDLLAVLREFRLYRSEVLTAGGRKSPVAKRLDSHFYNLGWSEKAFDTKIVVDDDVYQTPTHKVDCYKNRIALEVEWNNKDPFYDRDLNTFRILYDLRAIDVGVLITRCDELRELFAKLGASTTNMSKLLPRIEGGGSGGCPVIVFGIGRAVYVED